MLRAGVRITAIAAGRALLEPGHEVTPAEPDALIEEIVGRAQALGAETLYYDLGEVEIIDAVYLAYLNRLARACRTAGIRLVGIHLQPSTAYALAGLLTEPPAFDTERTVPL